MYVFFARMGVNIRNDGLKLEERKKGRTEKSTFSVRRNVLSFHSQQRKWNIKRQPSLEWFFSNVGVCAFSCVLVSRMKAARKGKRRDIPKKQKETLKPASNWCSKTWKRTFTHCWISDFTPPVSPAVRPSAVLLPALKLRCARLLFGAPWCARFFHGSCAETCSRLLIYCCQRDWGVKIRSQSDGAPSQRRQRHAS